MMMMSSLIRLECYHRCKYPYLNQSYAQLLARNEEHLLDSLSSCVLFQNEDFQVALR